MTATYTANPQTVPLDAVRWWCGDTDVSAALLQDTECTFAISMQPNDTRLAAALCCDALAGKYARRADITVGEVSKRNGAVAKSFRDQAEWLRDQAGKLALPFFGGQSQSAKDSLTQDTDAVQ